MFETKTFARLVSGALLTVGLFIVNGCVTETEKSVAVSSPEGTEWNCGQVAGMLVASKAGETVECGAIEAAACTPSIGCVSTGSGEFGVQFGALELDGLELSQDCVGNCGPMGLVWCGDATFKGQPYQDRWVCVPNIVDGLCHMKATAVPCDGEATCDLSGSYPTYGQCVSCTANVECDDQNPCTADSCNPATGTCAHPAVATGTPCDDGDKCNGIETCVTGVCKAGTPLDCNDNEVCTTEACSPSQGCVHHENSAACDDGDVCTVDDVCAEKSCQSGDELDCDDGNACTAETCDPVEGCAHAPVSDTTACDDGNACTLQDACAAGACTWTAKSCTDNNPCTTDTCNPATGACAHANLADGTVCGEGKQCVVGACTANADVCSTDGMTACRQVSGTLGYYECVVEVGQTKGTWQVLEMCGPIGSAVCLDGGGCSNAGATEAACADGLDNDGDGQKDCADPDCGAMTCDDGNVCTTDACTASGVCIHANIVGCPAPACTPACGGGKQCGDDGCSGSCGTCGAGKTCDATGQCVNAPVTDQLTVTWVKPAAGVPAEVAKFVLAVECKLAGQTSIAFHYLLTDPQSLVADSSVASITFTQTVSGLAGATCKANVFGYNAGGSAVWYAVMDADLKKAGTLSYSYNGFSSSNVSAVTNGQGGGDFGWKIE